MRRAIGVAALALLVTGCSTTERPEGIVERWLLALNQGEAGEPERYADRDVSDLILPNRRSADPGVFDVIEVGRAVGCQYRGPADCEAMVPFRVVPIDGAEIRSDALVGVDRLAGDTSRGVFAVTGSGTARLPSEGGEPIGSAGAAGWSLAIGTAVALTLVSEGAMRLTRRRRD